MKKPLGLAAIAALSLAGHLSAAKAPPRLAPIEDVTLLSGSPLHVALDGLDPDGQKLTFTATSDSALVSPFIPKGNRSLRIKVAGFGDMVFQLFEKRVPRATQRIIKLANGGFYDGVIFHRVMDGFVIQGGDPTGTGTGGSTLGSFDDQFHVDLQHNRTGLLSMAKTSDDTNDSQFFVTEGASRHLDFNHSIFGLLVEGENVRDAISGVPVGTGDRPITDVVMQSTQVFKDNENGVLMLAASDGATGEANVTVTVTDEDGMQASRTFRVTVTPDTVNSDPFLDDIPKIRTEPNGLATYQLVAIDVEGDDAFFLDQAALDSNGLEVPVRAHPDLLYQVDFDTGLLTMTPKNGLEGTHRLTVATARFITSVDYEVITVVIAP